MKYLFAESFDKVHHMRARLVKNVFVPEYSSGCMPKQWEAIHDSIQVTGRNGKTKIRQAPMNNYAI